MKKVMLYVSVAMAMGLNACNTKNSSEQQISSDSTAIARGALTFSQDCSACHEFDADAIGPKLGGITGAVSPDYLRKFISDPKAVIDAHDERATKLFERYKAMMPSFSHYTPERLDDLLAFLNTRKATGPASEDDPNALKNPIPDAVALSDLVVNLKLITQVPFSSEENPRTRIVKLDHEPNTDKEFILDLRGKLYYLDHNKPVIYMNMAKEMPFFINKPGLATGFGSFAFHPAFAKNGLLYTTHTEPPATKKPDFGYNDSIPVTLQWVLTEWKTKQPDAVPFKGQGRELFRINMVNAFHGMQEITFNPFAKAGDDDYGLLYIGIGDGGAVETKFPFLVRNKETLWGTIIRIDPAGRNSANGHYGIPSTNPFASGSGQKAAKEVYAYGFRNPHKITWTKSGQMLASNVGHTHIESFNLILPGHDYGWPIREGTFVHLEYGNMSWIYPLPANDASFGITYPVIQYDHDEGLAMAGGYEYTGSDVPGLAGKFFFADMNNGRLFYAETNDLQDGKQAPFKEWTVSVDGKPTTMAELCGNKRVDLRLGKDSKGELYVFAKPDGKIYKLANVVK